MDINWTIATFENLSLREFHDLIKLRVDVFVVEQTCPYPELDGLDSLSSTLHIHGTVDDKLVAYARALAPTATSSAAKIGRVVTDANYRHKGLARQMLERLLTKVEQSWPAADLKLSSQTRVTQLYRSLGFVPISEEYIEDGIWHIDMQRPARSP